MEFCNDFALKKNHWINSILLVSDNLPVRMPRKRSKSDERERKRMYRQNRTPEKIAKDKENDRKKKKEALSKKTEEAKK